MMLTQLRLQQQQAQSNAFFNTGALLMQQSRPASSPTFTCRQIGQFTHCF